MDEAIARGLEGLRVLGVRIPAKPSTGNIVAKLLKAKRALGLRSVQSLSRAREIADRRVRQCMSLLIEFIPPTYLTGNDRLFAAVVLEQAYLSLKHGNCSESASAFASYAVLLAGLGRLSEARDFGELAVRLTETNGLADARCRNFVLYALFAHSWSRPWQELRGWFERAVQAGHESGDLLFTTYACGWVALWDPTLDLKSAVEDGRKYLAIIERTNYHNARDVALLHLQFWAALLGSTRHELSLSDDHFDEAACEARMVLVRNVSGRGILAVCRLKLCVLYAEYERGYEIIRASEVEMRALAGSPYRRTSSNTVSTHS
jgi:predicted ATPase